MQRLIQTLLQVNFKVISIGLTIAILYLSLFNISDAKVDFNIKNIDKLFHATAYLFLTMSWLLAYNHQNRKNTILIACIFFGIIVEILQSKLTSYRTGDFYDILANVTGTVLALILYNYFLKKNTLI